MQKESNNQNYLNIRNNNLYQFNDITKRKENNNYHTFNSLININEQRKLNRDINLIKNNENKASTIESYLISFNPTKNQIFNFYKEDMIYHRPKSSSKFRINNKIFNL